MTIIDFIEEFFGRFGMVGLFLWIFCFWIVMTYTLIHNLIYGESKLWGLLGLCITFYSLFIYQW